MMYRALEVWAFIAIGVTNGVLWLAAISAVARPKARARNVHSARGSSVLVVCPFRGLDARAQENHRSLVEQRYEPYGVRFVCTSPDDPGLPLAKSICAAKSSRADYLIAKDCDDAVVSDKARNMICAWRSASDPYVGFCDSDLLLPLSAVAECMDAFDSDDVGAVFAHCIIDAPGVLGRIAMLTLAADAYALLVGCGRLGIVPYLQGGFMILKREAVECAGGIEMISGAIGDDTRIGRRLRRAGYQLRLAPFTIVHRTESQSVRDFVACYRRWLACHRTELIFGFWAETFLNPTVASVAFAMTAGRYGWSIVVVSALLRMSMTVFIDLVHLRRHGVRLGFWSVLRPLADVVHFVFCLSVVVYPWITWRGVRYAVGPRAIVRAVESVDDEKIDAVVETEAV